MTTPLNPAVALRLNLVRELYGELFLLMEQSLAEEPDAARSGSLDRTIELLMRSIEDETADFRREVQRARAEHLLGDTLERELAEFDAHLREGLTLLSRAIAQRIEHLSRERDRIKAALGSVHTRRRGAAGYREATAHAATELFRSHA